MHESVESSLEDFLEDPSLIYLTCLQEEAESAAMVLRERLESRWPSLSIRVVEPVELTDALLEARPDLVLALAHEGVADCLKELEKAGRQSATTAPILIADNSGLKAILPRSPSNVSEKRDELFERIVWFLERRQKTIARDRLRRFRLARLKRRNQLLRRLSLEDPLTRVLNRRGFRRFFKAEWTRAARLGADIAVVVVDIDQFKRINDTYGHAIGDRILRKFAEILSQGSRGSDILGRVGGEEFCVALNSCNEHQAELWAEKTRRRLLRTPLYVGGKALGLTASFGVAACQPGAREEQELIDMADQAMLVAKHAGRNRVVAASSLVGHRERDGRITANSRVVRLLLDSLALRDPPTFSHCHRVAQYSTMLAKHIGLGENEVWVAEVAGLLHDIGKIGLPDSVLRKPTSLDENEKKLVTMTLASSYDIARSAFGDGPVAETIRTSRVWLQDAANEHDGRLPIPGRIVSIADAFDSMTSQSLYRRGVSRDAAFAELHRCAGAQFDGDLVKEFRALLEGQPDTISM